MRTALLLMNDNYRENFIAFRLIPFRSIAFRTLVYFVSFHCIHFLSFCIIVNSVSLRFVSHFSIFCFVPFRILVYFVSFLILVYFVAFRNISFRFVSISFRSLVQPCNLTGSKIHRNSINIDFLLIINTFIYVLSMKENENSLLFSACPDTYIEIL